MKEEMSEEDLIGTLKTLIPSLGCQMKMGFWNWQGNQMVTKLHICVERPKVWNWKAKYSKSWMTSQEGPKIWVSSIMVVNKQERK